MDRNLFRYVWRHSRRDQLIVLGVVLSSIPFYFASLDLPRRIVNEAIMGGSFSNGTVTAFALGVDLPPWLGGAIRVTDGLILDQYQLLFTLAGLYLLLVCINGGLKYWINVAKGVLGERMLRRIRFELFGLVLRFTPESLRAVKSAEAATVIKDEVEPIGGFVGEAFIQPAFLGTQALTALCFIFVQSIWLGLVTAAVIAVQFLIIPRLRRELLRLGRERQLESRELAGRVSEIIDGMELVQVHGTAAWERAEFGGRLHRLFDLRLRIYKRKYIVKFLNNFLSQLTPFLFFSVGGYLALRGNLDVGQLVAVIAAYRELPPPLKELIDWDQQRLDVQIKYEQILQFFSADRLAPPDTDGGQEGLDITGDLVVEDLRVVDSSGAVIIDRASFALALPAHVALVAADGPGGAGFARVLGRRIGGVEGRVALGEVDLASLSPGLASRFIAYAGPDPILTSGTLRDNLTYGLRRRSLGRSGEVDRNAERRIAEARRTGNVVEGVDDLWVDASLAGLTGAGDLDEHLVGLLHQLGFKNELFAFGLASTVDGAAWPGFPERIVAARRRLREKLLAQGMAHLVFRFDPARFNGHASIAENLLLGAPTSPQLLGRGLIEDRDIRAVMTRSGLLDDLESMGAQIAGTTAELFRGISHRHALVERFSMLPADELDEFEAMVARRKQGRRLVLEERLRLIALALGYLEPRYRLGLLDDEIRNRVVAVRHEIRRVLSARPDPGVCFYEPEAFCPPAPLKCNLLFGRVNQSIAEAQTLVSRAIAEVTAELHLEADLERAGLNRQVGPGGRFLTPPQRAAVVLVRSLVKKPEILILDGALAPFGEVGAAALRPVIREMMAGRTLVAVVPNETIAASFPTTIRFRGGRAVVEAHAPSEALAVMERAG